MTLEDETKKYAGKDPRQKLPVCPPSDHIFVGYVSGHCCIKCEAVQLTLPLEGAL